MWAMPLSRSAGGSDSQTSGNFPPLVCGRPSLECSAEQRQMRWIGLTSRSPLVPLEPFSKQLGYLLSIVVDNLHRIFLFNHDDLTIFDLLNPFLPHLNDFVPIRVTLIEHVPALIMPN